MLSSGRLEGSQARRDATGTPPTPPVIVLQCSTSVSSSSFRDRILVLHLSISLSPTLSNCNWQLTRSPAWDAPRGAAAEFVVDSVRRLKAVSLPTPLLLEVTRLASCATGHDAARSVVCSVQSAGSQPTLKSPGVKSAQSYQKLCCTEAISHSSLTYRRNVTQALTWQVATEWTEKPPLL